ncbi:helicase SNF2 [Variovorax sp. JS1663]|uniref:helicase SNF2 n=1 Tax=Variovorax sp. JS1663 TaxID=1851577 RepID=UPI000B6E864A|nr:helicase SNF2 [Variovorax sp. JS1663]OUM01719.1 hypothetical protein A8M77_14245 [Variovorax sp. JS1663]
MKVHGILAAAALCLVGAAHAETYQGVHPLTSSNSRATVRVEAIEAAHEPDPYAEGYGADVPVAIVSTADRSDVRTEAVVAAHGPDPYAEGYGAGVPEVIASSADRAAVRAQAVAVAHHPEPFWAQWQNPRGDASTVRTSSLR